MGIEENTGIEVAAMKKDRKKNWTKPRHKAWTCVLRKILYPWVTIKYNVKIAPFKEQNGRQYLILYNHQTAFDQFFIALSFRGPVYYIATEDIFSLGILSKMLSHVVAPVPIKKQTTDIQAVKTCMRVAKEGGTLALAPEGNRTYNGKTTYIKPSVVPLIKKLKLPIAFFRIEGGYGVHPRWSDVVRKGNMKSYVSRVMEPEEYRGITDDELYEIICRELDVDEACVDGNYCHEKIAEYLERLIYVCPECGLSEFESHGDVIACTKCGLQVKYLSTKEMEGIGTDFPFRFVDDWYRYQCDHINGLDISEYDEKAMYHDTVELSEVILYQNKRPLLSGAAMTLYGNRITIGELSFSFDEIDVITVLGKNKLNIYHGDKVYQIKGSERFNALKYVNIYHRYHNLREGDANGTFLGL